MTHDKLFVGARDRRVFVYNKLSLELVKTIEVPESVHCICSLHNFEQVSVGMSDGHVMIIDCAPEDEPSADGVVVK